jgi:hypothetical protein
MASRIETSPFPRLLPRGRLAGRASPLPLALGKLLRELRHDLPPWAGQPRPGSPVSTLLPRPASRPVLRRRTSSRSEGCRSLYRTKRSNGNGWRFG